MTERARSGGRRLHGAAPQDDVERELRAHLLQREDELVAAGWERGAARAEAQRLFGDYRAVRRECTEVAERHARTTRRVRMWSELKQDVGYALRWLKREPGFAVLAVITLALGIGANTAAFSIVNGVLLAPLPFQEPHRLVSLRELNESGNDIAVAWPNFRDLQARARTIAAMAAYQSPYPVTVLGGLEPVRAPAARVTTSYFDVLGVRPARGRSWVEEERRVGGPAAVLVSDRFWRQQLGARADLTAVRLEVFGAAATVIGVMPPGFDAPDGADIWYPLDIEAPAGLGTRTAHNFRVVARLADGATHAAAAEELTSLIRQVAATGEDLDAVAIQVEDLREAGVADARRALLTLLGASGFVLLVACTNLGSALLARAARRRRELAIRAALGAARLRLVRQLLTESVLLALLGAAAGLLVAHLLVSAAVAVGPDAVPRLEEVRIDGWVLLFTTVLAVGTALTFGTAPALRAASAEPQEALQETARGGEGPRSARAWSLLVGVEVALALLLLVGSGLLIRSFYALTQVDPGFEVRDQLAVTISLPSAKYADEADRVRFYDQLLERVRALPGVAEAGVSISVPLVDSDPNGLFDLEGGEFGEGSAHYRVVGPGFFETMGMRVVQGRDFTAADREGALEVIIVNQRFVDRFLAGRDPLGERIRTGGMDMKGLEHATIVGVVNDVHFRSLAEEPVPAYYLAYAQRPFRIGTSTLIVGPRGRNAVTAATLRTAVNELDPQVPTEIAPLRERIGESLADRRFTLLVLGAFAGIALLLAAVGIYGVVAFAVAQRTREIGVRRALGAVPLRVVWTVSRPVMLSVIGGVAAGLAAAFALSRITATMLYEVEPVDPLTFAAVALLLIATACVALIVPARRALRVSPMSALRAE